MERLQISQPVSCLGLWTRALQDSSAVTQLGNYLITISAGKVLWLRTAFNPLSDPQSFAYQPEEAERDNSVL